MRTPPINSNMFGVSFKINIESITPERGARAVKIPATEAVECLSPLNQKIKDT